MEAIEFPCHVQDFHTEDPWQSFVCPVCALENEDVGEEENLLAHIQKVHADLKPVTFEHPLIATKPIGDRFVEQVLDRGIDVECAICFEEFKRGQVIYRMNCFCIYHSTCINTWFKKNNNKLCPVHGRQ
jgi:ferredoxin